MSNGHQPIHRPPHGPEDLVIYRDIREYTGSNPAQYAIRPRPLVAAADNGMRQITRPTRVNIVDQLSAYHMHHRPRIYHAHNSHPVRFNPHLAREATLPDHRLRPSYHQRPCPLPPPARLRNDVEAAHRPILCRQPRPPAGDVPPLIDSPQQEWNHLRPRINRHVRVGSVNRVPAAIVNPVLHQRTFQQPHPSRQPREGRPEWFNRVANEGMQDMYEKHMAEQKSAEKEMVRAIRRSHYKEINAEAQENRDLTAEDYIRLHRDISVSPISSRTPGVESEGSTQSYYAGDEEMSDSEDTEITVVRRIEDFTEGAPERQAPSARVVDLVVPERESDVEDAWAGNPEDFDALLERAYRLRPSSNAESCSSMSVVD